MRSSGDETSVGDARRRRRRRPVTRLMFCALFLRLICQSTVVLTARKFMLEMPSGLGLRIVLTVMKVLLPIRSKQEENTLSSSVGRRAFGVVAAVIALAIPAIASGAEGDPFELVPDTAV